MATGFQRLIWERRRRVLSAAGLAVFGLVALWAGPDFLGPDRLQAATDQPAPDLIRQGDSIKVPEGSPYRSRLVIQSVETRPLRRPLLVPAIVEADPAKTVKVLPPLSGRILDLKVGLGDTVAAGQPLAIIASPDLAQAYDDDAKAASARDLAKGAFERQRAVTGIGAGSTKDLETAKDALTQAEAEYQRTEARLKAVGQFANGKDQSRELVVRAPLAGKVTELDIAARGFINDPTQPIMTIAELDTVFITASVPEKDVAAAQMDQEAEIRFTAYPTEVFKGHVQSVSPLLEPDTRRTKVRIPFSNASGRFMPNMYATVTFMRTEIPQLVLPTSALLMNNDLTTVFVETAPWTFQRRAIELEYQAGETVTILNGIALGERVVVKGGVLLND